MSDTRTTGQRPLEQSPQQGLATPAIGTLSKRPLKEVKTVDDLWKNEEFVRRIGQSVPQHMKAERLIRVMNFAVGKTPLLREAPLRDLVGAFLTCSQVGLEPNTPMQHAHLIPFKKTKWDPQKRERVPDGVEIQFIFGYPGLLELHHRSPLVTNIQTAVVFKGDAFSYEYGTDAHLRHKPMGGQSRGEAPTHAYMMATLKDGFAFEVMPWDDVLAVRNKSQAYRQAVAAKEHAESKGWRIPGTFTEAPWVQHWVPMARKTVFRAGSKWLPRSVEMAAALAIDEAQEDKRNIDWGKVIDADAGDYLNAAATVAETSGERGDPEGAGYGSYQDEEQGSQHQGPGPTQQTGGGTQQRQEQSRSEREPQQETQRTSVFGGTSFGSEEGGRDAGDPGPSDDRGPPPATSKAAEDKPKPTPRPKAADLPDFSAVVMDPYGEPSDGVVHATRLDWAHGYATAWAACTGIAMIEALDEHNADALADVRQDKKAAKVLDGLNPPTARMIRDAEAATKAQAEAAAAAEAAERQAKEEADSRAAAAEAAAREEKPKPAETKPADQGESEPDTDAIWAKALCEDAEKASLDDVHAMTHHKGIKQRMLDFQKARPDLFKMVEAAFQKRLARKG